jgi:hypothetical protein
MRHLRFGRTVRNVSQHDLTLRYIDSPALGSAGPLMKRVCYGIVIPGLVIGAVLYIHIPAKYVFVRALRNTRHLTESTWQHWTAWT